MLVVEDDRTVNELLARALRDLGRRVVRAFDGPTALHIARTEQPALVTLDMKLPGMPGGAVLRALKADPLTTHIPVILISGVADTLPREQLSGAVALIRKPFDAEEVARALSYVLDGLASDEGS